MIMYLQAVMLTFIEVLCCIIFFDTFFEKRFTGVKDKIIFLAFYFGAIIISVVLGEQYIQKAVAAVLSICCAMKILFIGTWLQIAFLSVVYYSFVLLLDRIIFIFVLCVLQINEVEFWKLPLRATIIALLAKNVLFLVILLLKRLLKTTGNLSFITNKEWIQLLMFPVISVVCMTAFAVEQNGIGTAVLIVAFALIFLNFLVFYMIKGIIEQERKKQKIQLQQERTQNRITMYEYMEGVYAEQRKQLHDFKNYMTCVQGLLAEKAYVEAEKYLHTVNDNWVDEADYINTNHAIINSILNQKYKLARKKGIVMILSINDLEGNFLKDEDIVTLLSNLLDNAIEACEKLTRKPKNVWVRFWYENHQIIISTQNPIEEPVNIRNGRIYTTKNNQLIHGIGMQNIKNVVDKYGGEDIYSSENGLFTHSILLEENVVTAD